MVFAPEVLIGERPKLPMCVDGLLSTDVTLDSTVLGTQVVITIRRVRAVTVCCWKANVVVVDTPPRLFLSLNLRSAKVSKILTHCTFTRRVLAEEDIQRGCPAAAPPAAVVAHGHRGKVDPLIKEGAALTELQLGNVLLCVDPAGYLVAACLLRKALDKSDKALSQRGLIEGVSLEKLLGISLNLF